MSTAVTVEIAPRNELGVYVGASHFINFLGKKLRGRLDPSALAGRVPDEGGTKIFDMPALPGVEITLDYKNGTGLIEDPIGRTEYDSQRAQWQEVHKRANGGREFVPMAREEFPLNASSIATWDYWLRRYVNDGHARVADGQFIAKSLDGRIKVVWDNTLGTYHYKDQWNDVQQGYTVDEIRERDRERRQTVRETTKEVAK